MPLLVFYNKKTGKSKEMKKHIVSTIYHVLKSYVIHALLLKAYRNSENICE